MHDPKPRMIAKRFQSRFQGKSTRWQCSLSGSVYKCFLNGHVSTKGKIREQYRGTWTQKAFFSQACRTPPNFFCFGLTFIVATGTVINFLWKAQISNGREAETQQLNANSGNHSFENFLYVKGALQQNNTVLLLQSSAELLSKGFTSASKDVSQNKSAGSCNKVPQFLTKIAFSLSSPPQAEKETVCKLRLKKFKW